MRLEMRGRNLAEVEHDGAESAGVEQVVGGFQRVPGVVAATDPDQLRESYAGRGRRYGIERIVGVDVSADFKLGGGCGQQEWTSVVRPELSGPRISEMAPRGKPSDESIQRRDAGGKAFPDFGVRTQSECSDASGVWVHAISPFLRHSYFAHGGSCQE